ncbi:hypothetical protein Catovirus_2_265 [Catovirus CTV1]|uniref:Minor capsid protein P8 central region domain-containing protein n=1 Tax=Catovirus CTV1 TaxID=1977631 RepID=A0A1V0SC82_9VIRU|nr:hypothetical protein Catovirus_2_265 [Catovirus CTV1]
MNYSSLGTNENYRSSYPDYDLPTFEKLQEEANIKTQDFSEMALKGDFYRACDGDSNVDQVGKLYFSDENMKRVQKMIKREIYTRTKGVFRLDTDQDESDLLVAMRAVYYEHCRFLPSNIVRQVKELNRKLLDYIIPDVITQIKQSYAYIQEINQPLKPIARPINVNNAGRRTLPSLSSVWGI